MAGKIFCLEGEWETSYNSKLSVKSSLDLLSSVANIPYVFRTVSTHDEFYYHLKKSVRYESIDIVYLAFHGTKGTIWLPDGNAPTLEDLATETPNSFNDKFVLISACNVFKNEEDAKQFKKKTKAKMVIGYHNYIDFFESSMLDMACLHACVNSVRPGNIKTQINKWHPYLAEKTGLIIC